MASLVLKVLKDIYHALQCWQDHSATNICKPLCHTTSTLTPSAWKSFSVVGQVGSPPRACGSGRQRASQRVLPAHTAQLCPQRSPWLLREHPSNLTTLRFICQDILHINPRRFLLHTPHCLGEKARAWHTSALQLLEAPGRGEDEGTTQIHITQQAMVSLVLYDPSAHSKVHWNPADHQTFLKRLSLHMVYRRTAWSSASRSTTLCTSYWSGCTTCRACTDPKTLFEAEMTYRALAAFWTLSLKRLFMIFFFLLQHNMR